MEVHFFLVQGSSSPSVPAVQETTCEFTEETKPFAQVKIRVQHVPLHQIRISVRVIRPVWVADVFAAFPNPQAKRDVIVLGLTERNELNLSQSAGSTARTLELSRILGVSN